jgi:hypothetical protein
MYFLNFALFPCAPRQIAREPREIPERISKFTLMFPFRVQDAKDNDALAFDTIEKFVGKTAREQPAKITVIKWPAFGVVRQQAHRTANLVQQFIAQTRALGFIP